MGVLPKSGVVRTVILYGGNIIHQRSVSMRETLNSPRTAGLIRSYQVLSPFCHFRKIGHLQSVVGTRLVVQDAMLQFRQLLS